MKRILWFRRDLRTEDNPLLSLGGEVLPIFIFDKNILDKLPITDKRVSFLFEKVTQLKKELKEKKLDLKIFFGVPEEIFLELEKLGIEEVAASLDYDNYARERDLRISHILDFNIIKDNYIFKPEEILKSDKTPYLVFTPFYNKSKKVFTSEHMKEFTIVEQILFDTDYEDITVLRKNSNSKIPLEITSIGFEQTFTQEKKLEVKIKELSKKLPHYAEERDFIHTNMGSELSTNLRFGTISIRKLLRILFKLKEKGIDTTPFFRQLVFRDFYAYLLYHFPSLETENHKYNFKGIEDEEIFLRFCTGNTGVPIVDAGIRELLTTGLMHNRVRMVCASFLTKDLLLPWQWGEKFFAQHLMDYDKASNILSWQWSAGTGIDPQPYFRIFNPYLQSKKFDKDTIYIKKWIPELSELNSKDIHNEEWLLKNKIDNYPFPMVVHKEASQTALAYFKKQIS